MVILLYEFRAVYGGSKIADVLGKLTEKLK